MLGRRVAGQAPEDGIGTVGPGVIVISRPAVVRTGTNKGGEIGGRAVEDLVRLEVGVDSVTEYLIDPALACAKFWASRKSELRC